MIRVLWKIGNTSAWTGGLNYFRNLYGAVTGLPERVVEPVILETADHLPEPLSRAPTIPAYAKPRVPAWHPTGVRKRIESMVFGRDRAYERYLRDHGIELLSHLAFPQAKTDIPFLGWIPDFQHRHLPHLFSREEVADRTERQALMAEIARGVLLSSEDARRDFNHFYPGHEGKTRVLRFVAIPPPLSDLPPIERVLRTYEIGEPYFHVPNQVWAHKNHGIVLEALRLLRERGKCPLVVSTGQTADYRDPTYFQRLSRSVEEAGMSERYRFLGLIDYRETCVLMRGSEAMINPSLFEGWSTTVEEAKSLGKCMLLSTLAVHREQAHDRSWFFEPHNAEQLARLMEETLASRDPAAEAEAMQRAHEMLSNRVRAYGMEYEAIVRDMTAPRE